MKQFSFSDLSSSSSGGVLERLEIIRSRLRLANRLERRELDALQRDLSALRGDVLLLSRGDRLQDLSRQDDDAGRRLRANHDDLGFQGVLGESPELLEALEIVRKAAPTNLPLLIDGESGTGKELFARVIHDNSQRADGPFVSINCGAIPENLIESELFGHKKGAFTGASSDRRGRFEAANGGTIFLDEVGELPLQGQVKLLRVLQAREVQRVGSDQPISVDTRVVAATNRNLAEMAQAGTFREDLFYRLSVIHASLPPLRKRRDEIPLLCEFFIAEASEELGQPPIELTEPLMAFLRSYSFPGNIRQLRNIIYRVACLADGQAGLEHLPVEIRDMNPVSITAAEDCNEVGSTLAEVKKAASDAAERRFLESGLRATSGRVVDLARKLEMNRSHLQTLLKKHGLQSKSFRPNSR